MRNTAFEVGKGASQTSHPSTILEHRCTALPYVEHERLCWQVITKTESTPGSQSMHAGSSAYCLTGKLTCV